MIRAPIATTISLINNTSNNFDQIYFSGRIFNNEKEALTYLVRNKKINIKDQKVLGNIGRSYANIETGLLIKSLLPNYDISKIKFAYFNAGGGIVDDYNQAKNTYYNPGTITKSYDDGFGGLFLDANAAENSMRNHSMDARVGFYNVKYLKPDTGQGMGTRLVKLNPFSTKDIHKYKENIKENIFDLITTYAKDSYLNSNQDSFGYSLDSFKVSDKNNRELNSNNHGFELWKIMKNFSRENRNEFSFDDNSKEIISKYNHSVSSHLKSYSLDGKSEWIKIGWSYGGDWKGSKSGAWFKNGSKEIWPYTITDKYSNYQTNGFSYNYVIIKKQ